MSDDYDLMHKYTRKQAIEDGVLVDATVSAREARFRFPVALTRAVWEKYVNVPEGVEGQDEAGRLWDVLYMLHYTVKRSADGDTILFQLRVRNDNQAPRPVTLKAVCGPDDDGTPCITVMMTDED